MAANPDSSYVLNMIKHCERSQVVSYIRVMGAKLQLHDLQILRASRQLYNDNEPCKLLITNINYDQMQIRGKTELNSHVSTQFAEKIGMTRLFAANKFKTCLLSFLFDYF